LTLGMGTREERIAAAMPFAWAALVIGLLYTAVSVYWGVGGTWLLDTVGGSLATGGRAGDAAVLAALWGAVVLKLVAAVLPLEVLRRERRRRHSTLLWRLAWAEAAILTAYGFVLTAVGLLVQADLIHRARHADERALAWHAYLWDPWFLVWGLLVARALAGARQNLSGVSSSRQKAG
jgi:hypothetical protein